jgi:recombination protein RecT
MAEKQKEQSIARKQELALVKEDIVDKVALRVNELVDGGQLRLPDNYSPENALHAAWLKLQSVETKDGKLAIHSCTPDSVANSILDMIVQGLTPAKDQCYLYAGDEFEYEIAHGRKRVVKHVQKLENVDITKIIAAYAVIEPRRDELPEQIVEVMPIDKIRKAWAQGQMKGKSPAHERFTDEMAKKTVISRTCKMAINSSDDSYLVEVVNRQAVAVAEAVVEMTADEEANVEVIDFDDAATDVETSDVIDVEPDPESKPAPVDDADELEPEEGSPRARFGQMIRELELDATIARRVAAEMIGVDDVRKLGNIGLASILNDPDAFLKEYGEATRGEDQPSLIGPSF